MVKYRILHIPTEMFITMCTVIKKKIVNFGVSFLFVLGKRKKNTILS